LAPTRTGFTGIDYFDINPDFLKKNLVDGEPYWG